MKVFYYVLLLSTTLLLFTLPALAAERFVFDKALTAITFSASAFGLMDVVGQFDDYDGSLWIDDAHPEASQINIVLRSASVRTFSRELDKVLRGEHWFNSHQFPEIRFVSTGIKVHGQKAILTGNLTFIGQVRPLTLTIHAVQVARSEERCFDAIGVLDLSDFGSFLLSRVQLTVHAVGIRQ